MRYDLYLASGYPIASGVSEGACRHYVNSQVAADGPRAFQKFRIEREAERLYPHRQLLDSVQWGMAG
jgi:hypothetical protein